MITDSRPCPGIVPGTRVWLPAVPHRFRWAFHPDYHAVIQEHEAWVLNDMFQGDVEKALRLLEFQGALLTCTGYPDGERDRVRDICDITGWWWAVDDDLTRISTDERLPMDTRGANYRDYVDDLLNMAVGGPIKGVTPWKPQVVEELARRLHDRRPDLFPRVVQALDFWRGTDPGDDRAGVSSIKDYLAARFMDAGCFSFMIFAEYVMDLHLPDEVRAQELVREHDRTMAETWILPNDLLSFRGECMRGDHFNAVCVLRRTEGLSLQEALDWVAARIDQAQRRVLELRQKILISPLGDAPGLHTYLDTLQTVGSANQRFSYYTPRYHGQGFRWNGELTGEVTLHANHTQFPSFNLDREQ